MGFQSQILLSDYTATEDHLIQSPAYYMQNCGRLGEGSPREELGTRVTPGSPVAVLQLIGNCFRLLTKVMPSGVLAQAPVPAEWGAGG